MKRRIKTLLGGFILLVSFPYSGSAQLVKTLSLSVDGSKSAEERVVETNFPTTGIVVHISSGSEFTGSYLVLDADTFLLQTDPHTENQDRLSSNLVTVSEPVSQFYFYPGNVRGEVLFTFIDSRMPADMPERKVTKKKSLASCSEPEMIDQEVWRAGLPEPNYDRLPNTVHNLIIHHSAGSNTDDNYLQVIRSIYIYHTAAPPAGRGWSDIGYNYVIAQDGTIFKARDPGELEQDNVVGAHFCAANTGTMGTCLMGDYTNIEPPDTMIASLVKLLNWKAGKDSLNPLGYHPHRLNSGLSVIAGHRDGCATQCPGERVYQKLDEIRDSTWYSFINCQYYIKPDYALGIDQHETSVRLSQRGNRITIHRAKIKVVEVYNLMGQPVSFDLQANEENQSTIILRKRAQQLVIIRFKDIEGWHSEMVFVP